MRKRLPLLLAFALSLVLGWAGQAAAVTFTTGFEGLADGEIVTTDIAGVTISVDNVGGGPDLAVIYDSSVVHPGPTADKDPDLEAPWAAGGNLGVNTVLNNLLVIQENSTGCGDGVCDEPDDEGSRPAGTLTFDFGANLFREWGWDFVDVEGPVEFGPYGGFGAARILFANSTGIVANITFAALNSFEPTIVWGNHRANRIYLNSADLGGISFNTVIYKMGGSGGIDNIIAVPEPGTAMLIAALALGVVAVARRKEG